MTSVKAPNFWGVYFAVDDCAAAGSKAEALGGAVTVPPMDVGPGTFAGLTDPTGAFFFVGAFPSA